VTPSADLAVETRHTSSKRRARDAPVEDDDPGISGEIKATNPRAVRLNDDVLEALRLEVQNSLKIHDPETREDKVLDINDPADMRVIQETHDVLVRDEAGASAPYDMRTGQLMLRSDTLPDNVNETSVFPFNKLSLGDYMRVHEATINKFLSFLPLFDVPVHTSPLVLMIRLNLPQHPTQSAYAVFRLYFSVIHILLNQDIVRRRIPTAMKWIKQRAEDKMLTPQDIDTVAAYAVFQDEVPEAETFSALKQHVADGTVTTAHIETCFSHAFSLSCPSEGTPWAKDMVFAEDIFEEHPIFATAETDKAGKRIDELIEKAGGIESVDVNAVHETVFSSTVDLLRIYEITIMRLLSESAIGKATIPLAMFGDFLTPDRFPDPATEVHLRVRPLVRKTRRFITAVHNHFIDPTDNTRAAVDVARDDGDDGDAGGGTEADLVPTPEEVIDYVKFSRFFTHISGEPDVYNETLARVSDLFVPKAREDIAEAVASAAATTDAIIASKIDTEGSATPDANGIVWEPLPTVPQADIPDYVEDAPVVFHDSDDDTPSTELSDAMDAAAERASGERRVCDDAKRGDISMDAPSHSP